MESVTSFLTNVWGVLSGAWWIPIMIGLLLLVALGPLQRFTLKLFGVILIPEDSVGVVNIKFLLFRKFKTLPDGKIIALRGEAGYQAKTLAPGVHFLLWPWQFEVKIEKFIHIPPGSVGVVEAIDGKPIPSGRVLANHVDCDMFQDASAFLTSGGERGTQITVMPPGDYRLNTALFKVVIEKALTIPDSKVGIVTTLEGKSLEAGEIAGPPVGDTHRNYQIGQAFLDAGGTKGLQVLPILAGMYYLNPRFAKVEVVDMTRVPIGEVGVVVAYVGEQPPAPTDAAAFKHGVIVQRGQKGVWSQPFDPGMYPINPHTHKVEMVPTTNIVLNWADGKTAAHALDKNLSTITVRSADGFTFPLDVSQIIHISRDKASAVIARFGSVSNLVSQVLEPIIGNHFRISAQGSDAIDFLLKRDERQKEAKQHIETALTSYDVQAVDSLIGDIVPPEELMKTLTERKVAERLEQTYQAQRKAEDERQNLEQSKAQADTRSQVVNAQRRVEVAELDAQATVKEAEGKGRSQTILADANAHVLKVTGDAQAANTAAIGGAEADVLQKKVTAVGANSYALMAVVKDLAEKGTKLVPDVLVQGGGANGGGNVTDALLAVLTTNVAQLNGTVASSPSAPAPTPEAPAQAA